MVTLNRPKNYITLLADNIEFKIKLSVRPMYWYTRVRGVCT